MDDMNLLYVCMYVCMAGLSQLLKDTDFFANDLKNIQLPGTITMMVRECF